MLTGVDTSPASSALFVLSAGIGSALGGMARYLVVVAIETGRTNARWPLGTLVVNLLGSLLLGLLLAGTLFASVPALRLAVIAALGSFTTVSAFVLESWQRRADRRTWLAYGLVTVLGCLAMYGLGRAWA